MLRCFVSCPLLFLCSPFFFCAARLAHPLALYSNVKKNFETRTLNCYMQFETTQPGLQDATRNIQHRVRRTEQLSERQCQ
jgi:hypothetical protein